MDEQERRFREIAQEIRNLSEGVFASEYDLKKSISRSREDLTLSLLNPLRNIEGIVESDSASLDRLNLDLKYYFGRNSNELRGILKSVSLVADTSKAAIKADNDKDSLIESFSKLSPSASNITVEAVGNPKSESAGLDKGVEKKLSLVLDSAAGFLKSWGSPVEVGVALTFPIVGAIGALTTAIYFTVDKVSDGITKILSNGIGGLSSSIIGAVGTAVGGIFTGGSGSVSEAVDVQKIVTAVDSSTNALLSPLKSIENTLSQLELKPRSYEDRKKISLDSLEKSISSNRADLARSITSAADRVIFSISNQSQSKSDLDTIKYQNKVIELLSTPVQVKLIETERTSDSASRDRTVFSEAVRPLVANQEALLNMLGSRLRLLSEAITDLKAPAQKNEVDRTTRVNDTVNMELSEDTQLYILSEARQIRTTLESFRSSFSDFSSKWEKRKDPTVKGNMSSSELSSD